MLRRLLLCAALIVAFASLGSFTRTPATVEAAPANQSVTIYVTDHQDAGSDQAQVEFQRGEGRVWAHVEGIPAGANLSYILRLNGDDYKWGKLDCCKSGGTAIFAITSKDDGSIPGGAYLLLVYDGDKELGRTGFGVKGGKGSDNDNDH
ncbi:MAG: hypothetical protein U0893_26015 [Chloroflexota bacterium]